MTVTVSIIAERALRRLGVAVVPVDARPALNTRTAPADIATAALIELGVIAIDAAPQSQASIVPLDTIATIALTKLGVIAADEGVAPSDMTLARGAVDAVHSALVASGTVKWTSAQITTAVSEEYAGLTAFHLASSFGKQSDPALVPVLEARIATVSRVAHAHALALTKLAQVQASLVSQALVTWDNLGVPTAVAEEYTRLTAMSLASSFGKQVDPKLVLVLEDRVRRMAQVLAAPGSANDAVQAVHDDLVAQGLARWSVFDIPAAVELPYELLAANRLAPLFDKQAIPHDEVLAIRSLAKLVALGAVQEPIRAEYF